MTFKQFESLTMTPKRIIQLSAVAFILVSVYSIVTAVSKEFGSASAVTSADSILYTSKAFRNMVSCTDQSDGIECFNNYKGKLLDEAKLSGFSALELDKIDFCFLALCQKANDLALLLNIQNCYHEIDFARLNFHKGSSGNLSKWVERFLYVALPSFMLLLNVFWVMSNKREVSELQGEIEHSKVIYNNLLYRCSSLENENRSLNLRLKSEINNVQARLNKGGNIRKELDRINIRLLNVERNTDPLSSPQKGYSTKKVLLSPPFQPYASVLSIRDLNKKNKGGFYDQSSTHEKEGTEGKNIKENIAGVEKSNWPTDEPTTENDKQSKTVVAKIGGITFDLTNNEGKAKWRDYCQHSAPIGKETRSSQPCSSISVDSGSGASSAISLNLTIKPNQNISKFAGIFLKVEDHSKLFAKSCPLDPANLKPLSNLQKFDKTGKPYRRIFIPGQGWTSAKKLKAGEVEV